MEGKKRKNDKKARLTFILFRLDQTETPKFKKKINKKCRGLRTNGVIDNAQENSD